MLLEASAAKLENNADKRILYTAIALLQANRIAGTDAAALARELMQKYGFTGAQWNYVID